MDMLPTYGLFHLFACIDCPSWLPNTAGHDCFASNAV